MTGLLYVDPLATDLHTAMNTVDQPLNGLEADQLCPGRPALDDQRLAIFVDDIYHPFLVPKFSTAPLSRNFVGGTTPESFVEFAIEMPLTDGLHKIEFRLSASGTSRAGISMDDTFVTAIPEPSLLSLSGTALALLLTRRQRNHEPNHKSGSAPHRCT